MTPTLTLYDTRPAPASAGARPGSRLPRLRRPRGPPGAGYRRRTATGVSQGGAPVCRILFRMVGLGCLGCKPHTAPANILSMRVNERKFERTGAEVNTEEEAHTELIPYARAACLKKAGT